MSLNFPILREIPLEKAPLAEVICQVKFSPILSISKDLPIEFQETVRDRFPGLEIEQGMRLQLPISGVPDKPLMDATPRIFRFTTTDKTAYLALTTDFLALSTKAYTHWKDFLQDFVLAETALRKIYHPAYATRIGLRFVNRFTRKNTGLNLTRDIFRLFRDELTCILHTEAWVEPKEMLSQMVLVDNNASLALRIGYGKEQKKPFFVLDFDYFEEGQISYNKLQERLDHYHSRIYSAFRWCVKESSLELFNPRIGN